MSDQPPEGPREDWMETWYETGELPVPKPLAPEANERILRLFDELIEEQEKGETSD